MGEQLCRHWKSETLYSVRILDFLDKFIFSPVTRWFIPELFDLQRVRSTSSFYWPHLICNHRAECIDDLGAFICIMLLFVEAILFGIFTLCMMGEQLSSASSNESHIDRLKAASSGDERVKEKLEVRIINEIFGCDMAVR